MLTGTSEHLAQARRLSPGQCCAAAADQAPRALRSGGLAARAACPEGGNRRRGGQGSVCGGGQAGVGGVPSGVCVDGGDVTQAVVKGPVGEEAAVLGAAGHDVF